MRRGEVRGEEGGMIFVFFLSVDIQYDCYTRTFTCTTNGSETLTWEANGNKTSLWSKDVNIPKTMDIGQGGSANGTLIKAIPNGMMQSTFVVLSPGSLKSLTVMCITEDGTNKTFSVQMESFN